MLVAFNSPVPVPKGTAGDRHSCDSGEDGWLLKRSLGAEENEGSGSHPWFLVSSLIPPS